MSKRLTLIAIASVAAAAAFAQTPNIPPELRTSTAGNGCTATANAMRGGNLGGSPTLKPCGDAAAPMAAAPAVQSAVVAAPVPVAESTSMGSGAAAPMRAARADRN